jgi:glycine dehydrogenase subunit 1
LLGETGLKRLARVNHANAVRLADMLARIPNVEVMNDSFFNEFILCVRDDATEVVEKMAARGVLGGVPVSRLLPDASLDDLLLVASTEINTDEDRAAFVSALQGAL